MKRGTTLAKMIAIDLAGIALIVCAPLLGWLPGPGGIPLLLAGLALLSINHEWARRIRDKLISQGSNVAKMLFPDNAAIKWLYDIFCVGLIASAVYGYTNYEGLLASGGSAATSVAASMIFLINRRRGERLTAWFKRQRGGIPAAADNVTAADIQDKTGTSSQNKH